MPPGEGLRAIEVLSGLGAALDRVGPAEVEAALGPCPSSLVRVVQGPAEPLLQVPGLGSLVLVEPLPSR